MLVEMLLLVYSLQLLIINPHTGVKIKGELPNNLNFVIDGIILFIVQSNDFPTATVAFNGVPLLYVPMVTDHSPIYYFIRIPLLVFDVVTCTFSF